MEKKNEKCKLISHIIIFLDIIFCIAFPFNINNFNNILDIGLGFFTSSLVTCTIFIIKEKPEWICNVISELKERFDPFYCLMFIVCVVAAIFLLILFFFISYPEVLEVVFGDFELMKDLLKERNNADNKYMIASFLISFAILSYSYNVANKTCKN